MVLATNSPNLVAATHFLLLGDITCLHFLRNISIILFMYYSVLITISMNEFFFANVIIAYILLSS